MSDQKLLLLLGTGQNLRYWLGALLFEDKNNKILNKDRILSDMKSWDKELDEYKREKYAAA